MRLAILFIVATQALVAQTAQPPTFRAESSLVPIDAQVVEAGRPLAGLRVEDFILREEGVPRPIVYFGRESEPIQVVLLLDISGSMGPILRDMAASARSALASLRRGDQVAVALFARHARVTLELTPELDLAVRALKEAPLERSLGAGTSINEALLDVAAYLETAPPFSGRRAIVILTDNGGMHYQTPDDKVQRALAGAGAVLNAIVSPSAKPPSAPSPGGNPDFTPADVFSLAARSGGEVLRASKASAPFQLMLERLRLRYSLAIRPSPAPPGTFLRLQLDLSADARRRHPKAEIRARAGYYAPQPTSSSLTGFGEPPK
ncbi:MAG: VWA domain-containing protein [Acidobacteria bacterium]|nr:VWA domain-containing protein [Acidobacteriota bacterium]